DADRQESDQNSKRNRETNLDPDGSLLHRIRDVYLAMNGRVCAASVELFGHRFALARHVKRIREHKPHLLERQEFECLTGVGRSAGSPLQNQQPTIGTDASSPSDSLDIHRTKALNERLAMGTAEI